jgi:hypothetical protein
MPSVPSINKILCMLLIVCVAGTACGHKTKEVTVVGPHKIVPEEADNIEGMLSEPAKDSAGKLTAKVKGKLTAP